MDDVQIIQQLWLCLQRGYTYEEAKIHIEAFNNGLTTERKVITVPNELWCK